MLNIGDVITIQYYPWSNRPVTYYFPITIVKQGCGQREHKNLFPHYLEFPNGLAYSKMWDNASPLFRALGWYDEGHIGYVRLQINNKPEIIQIKLLKVEKNQQPEVKTLSTHIESKNKLMKAIDLRNLLDNGNILTFQFNELKIEFHPDERKQIGLSKIGQHDVYINDKHWRRDITFNSELHKKYFKDQRDKTDEEKDFDTDMRFILRMNYPEVTPTDKIGKYFINNYKKSNTKKTITIHKKERKNWRIQKKIYKAKIKKNKDIRKIIQNARRSYLTSDGKMISVPRDDENIGHDDMQYIAFYNISVENIVNGKLVKTFEIVEGYDPDQVMDTAIRRYFGNITLLNCIGGVFKSKSRLERLKKREKAKKQAEVIKLQQIAKKDEECYKHERSICVKNTETNFIFKLGKDRAEYLVKHNNKYKIVSKQEWKEWKKEYIKSRGKNRHTDSPYGAMFPGWGNKTCMCMRSSGLRKRGKRKYVTGSRHKRIQLISNIKPKTVINLPIKKHIFSYQLEPIVVKNSKGTGHFATGTVLGYDTIKVFIRTDVIETIKFTKKEVVSYETITHTSPTKSIKLLSDKERKILDWKNSEEKEIKKLVKQCDKQAHKIFRKIEPKKNPHLNKQNNSSKHKGKIRYKKYRKT